jgi:hypothetical protein
MATIDIGLFYVCPITRKRLELLRCALFSGMLNESTITTFFNARGMLQDMEEIRINRTTRETWRKPYKAAMAETNPVESRKKMDLACTAILQRIDELAGIRDKSAIEEQLEILDSLRNLRKIQRLEFRGAVDGNQLTDCSAQEGGS